MNVRASQAIHREISDNLTKEELRTVLGKLTYRRHIIRDFSTVFSIIRRLLKLVEQGAQIPRVILEEELLRRDISV